MSARADRAERLVFVGGAPRSGTTVTHALLCTANEVGHFHPEIAFFRGLAVAYRVGAGVWDKNTSAFFASPDDFRALMRETAMAWLDRVWRAVGRPRTLCMKEPHLTPYFPDLCDLIPEARFITVCRHPFDVVRSRQDVLEKSEGTFGKVDALNVAREYETYYDRVLSHNFDGRHLMFRYEDLNLPKVRRALAHFIKVDGFDVAEMWRGTDGTGVTMPAGDVVDPWISPKTYGEIDLGRRLEPLSPELQEVVRPVCQGIMTRMNYSETGTSA
jgi:hypothetical protein